MIRFYRREKAAVRHARVQCELLESRQLLTVAITATLPAVSVAANEGAFAINLSNYFAEPSPEANIAFFATNFGVIPVQLTPNATPKTVANFEKYVNSGAYSGSIISQSQPGNLFAGGVYDIVNKQLAAIPANAPVVNEFGASNVRGTLAAGLESSDPNSATNSFVFNDSDVNTAAFDAEKLTVFGNVIGTYGLAVMDAIANVPVPNPPPISGLPALPVVNFTQGSSLTIGQLVQVNSVTIAGDGFAVTSDNPAVAAGVVTGDNLTYTPLSVGTAHLTVTAVGSDGQEVSQTFAVIVGPANPATPLSPSGAGKLPTSLISGQPAKIHQTFTLTASQDVDSDATIALSLTPNSGNGADFVLASTQKHVKLKSGKHLVVRLSVKQLAADIPAGTYQVAIAVTDANSQSAIVTSSQTITVVQPQIDLGGSFKTVVANVKAGHKGSATLLVTNSGNIEASGLLKLDVNKSTDNSLLEAPVKLVHIKPGKSIAIHLSWSAGVSGEQYSLNVQIDPNDAFNDTNLANNTIVSPTVVTVG